MSEEDTTLRDFFYLDVDRVRSLLAQLREGIPEAFEKTRVQKGEGGIKVGLSLDYAYERGESETRSVHHYMYSIFEQTLAEADRLKIISDRFPPGQWGPDGLPDGCLVLARGRIRLLDFEKICDALDSVPRILDAVQGHQRFSLKQELQKGTITQRDYEKALRELREQSSGGLDRKDMHNLVETVREMYSATLRLKVFPFHRDDSRYLVGNVSADHLQQPRASLWLTGGVESQSKWSAMGIVNQLRAVDPASISLPPNPTLEEHLEQVLLAFSGIARVAASVELPAISFTPLAIYRQV